MVFHALRVPYGIGLGNTQRQEKVKQQFVASSGGFRHASARCGEGNGPIGLLHQQAFMGESLKNACDRDVADGHSRGKILDPAGVLCFQDFLDGFHVVLGCFRGVIPSGLAELVGDWTHVGFPDLDL